ncbi:hypothetical protein [Tunturiibacter lichenicola]|uniref:hypothetical protein n=1 Tax=Tunturiibacter lichenicola TaxID=2051959 RepID=UPI0021B2135B|nr:hypothetical protein [Edaphobacter lichenicola]
MALLAPPGLLGINTNMPATVPDDIAKALQSGGTPPTSLSTEERRAYEQLDTFYKARSWIRPGDEQSPADAVRTGRFTYRARGMDPRP